MGKKKVGGRTMGGGGCLRVGPELEAEAERGTLEQRINHRDGF